jgi:predicted secreted protein
MMSSYTFRLRLTVCLSVLLLCTVLVYSIPPDHKAIRESQDNIMLSSILIEPLSQLNFIGFSTDGKYLAFEIFGARKGSGAPFSEFYFLDVPINDWVYSPVKHLGPEGDVPIIAARREAAGNAYDKLEGLGIQSGNQGVQVAAANISDAPAVKQTGFSVSSGSYTLSLEETQVPCKDDIDGELFPFYMMALKVTNTDENKTVVLQKDSKLPGSRGCPLGYSIHSAFVYKEVYLAVFLSYQVLDFEGPSTKYICITGILPSTVDKTTSPAGPVDRGGSGYTLIPFVSGRQSDGMDVTLRYPQIPESDMLDDELRFNETVRRLAGLVYKDFSKEFEQYGDKWLLDMHYRTVYQSDRIISVLFELGYYLGGAHGMVHFISLNYDLMSDRMVALDDLFYPASAYLSVISEYCAADLASRENVDYPWDLDGVAPNVENYRSVNIAEEGLLVSIPPYQVAPYAAGPQEILVPYQIVWDRIDADGPLGPLLQ